MGGFCYPPGGRFRSRPGGNEDGVRVLFWLYAAVPGAVVAAYAALGLGSG
jgi:hypothetical protein